MVTKFILFVTFLMLSVFCRAAADADIAAGITDSLLTWAAVKTGLVGIGVFLLAYGFFKKLRRG